MPRRASFRRDSRAARSDANPAQAGRQAASNLIQRATLPLVKSNSATRDAFHRLHHPRRPSFVATHVYGYDDGTRSLVLRSKRLQHFSRRGIEQHRVVRKIIRNQKLVLAPIGTSAKPAGYGIAVWGGAFNPTASFFPVDSGCGAIGMKRSGATFPAAKPYTAIPFPVLPAFAPVGSVNEPIDA